MSVYIYTTDEGEMFAIHIFYDRLPEINPLNYVTNCSKSH